MKSGQRPTRRAITICAFLLTLALPGCEASSDARRNSRHPLDPDGVGVTAQPLIAAGCTVSGSAMTATVQDGETITVSLRTSDSMVLVNGHVFSGSTDTGVDCELPANGTLLIQADAMGQHTLGRSVFLDYANGLYLLGSGMMPGIRIDFTLSGDSGALNTLNVRGSSGIDLFALGAGTGSGASAVYALNVNAKMGAPTTQTGGTGNVTVSLDTIPDVTLKVIPVVAVNSGDDADVLDASGVAGVGTAYPLALQLLGNNGNDTITGGLGADVLTGGPGNDILNGCAGDDTYAMGPSAAGADVIAEACTMDEGNDTLDYSARNGNLTINLSNTLTPANALTDTALSGEGSGDNAHISDKIVNIRLGAGDDTLTVPSTSTVSHKVLGGAGDDTLNGGGAVDTFDGQAGDDTCSGTTAIMDYSARSAAVSVTLCTGSCPGSTADDGDPSASGSTHTGSAATTNASGGIALSVLTGGTGFTSASVGNLLTLSNCSGGSTDQAAFPIVAYTDPTSVKLDVTSVGGFIADTCDFSEALPDTTTRLGTHVSLATKTTSPSVENIDHTSHLFGHQITISHSVTSTGGGPSHTDDDGTYRVLKVLSSTAVAIDASSVGTFAGGVTALTWTESGAEHDSVQCANVVGGAGGDTIIGDARRNVLRGGTGADRLEGGDGNDNLYGEADNDTLYGGAGADYLMGGGGSDADTADVLVGGDGNDVLEGDADNDTFTCDGANSSTSMSAGTSPGDSDFTIDYTPGPETRAADCEW